MKSVGIFVVVILALLFSSCKKKDQSDYHAHSSGYPYPATYTYYHIKGVLTDTLGNPIGGKTVYMEGPCVAYSTTNNSGEFSFTTCELDGKWDYFFGTYFTVKVRDTASIIDDGQMDFLSSSLIKNDTLEIKIKLPF